MFSPVLICAAVLFVSGMGATVLLRRHRRAAALLNAVIPLSVLTALLPLVVAMFRSPDGGVSQRRFTCELESFYGTLHLGMDALGLFFSVFLLISAAVLALSDWRKDERLMMNGFQWTVYGGLVMSVFGVFISDDGLTFLFFSTLSSVGLFILMMLRNREKNPARTGWLYLFFSQFGFMALVCAFSIMVQGGRGDFRTLFVAMCGLDSMTLNAIFLLIVIGLGAKSGLFPFYFWLPQSYVYPPLPLSGLVAVGAVNIGVYGLLRFADPFLSNVQFWWGPFLLLIGLFSVLSGSFSALLQNDMRRLLGFTTLTYLGLIWSACGLVFSAAYYSCPEAVVLIVSGVLFQTISHTVVQPLLLMTSQAAEQSVGSNMNHAGGLARQLPVTTLSYATGALANSLLPPFTGFVSVLFVLLGVVRLLTTPGLPSPLLLLTILTAVEFIAAMLLLATGYLKSFGLFFLGDSATRREEISQPEMFLRVMIRLQLCILVAIFALTPLAFQVLPYVMESILDVNAGTLEKVLFTEARLPVSYIWGVSLLMMGATALIAYLTRRRVNGPIWRCGFPARLFSARFSAFSFSKPLTDFASSFLPPIRKPFPKSVQFPKPGKFEARPDLVFQVWFFNLLPEHIAAFGTWLRRFEVFSIQGTVLFLGMILLFFLAAGWL